MVGVDILFISPVSSKIRHTHDMNRYWYHLLQFDRMYIALIDVTMTVDTMAMAMAMTMAMTMMFCARGWSDEFKIYCRIAALTMGEERA